MRFRISEFFRRTPTTPTPEISAKPVFGPTVTNMESLFSRIPTPTFPRVLKYVGAPAMFAAGLALHFNDEIRLKHNPIPLERIFAADSMSERTVPMSDKVLTKRINSLSDAILNDPNENVRKAAAEALHYVIYDYSLGRGYNYYEYRDISSTHPDLAATVSKALVHMMSSDVYNKNREQAAYDLKLIKNKDPETIKALITALNDADVFVFKLAAENLFGTSDMDAITAFKKIAQKGMSQSDGLSDSFPASANPNDTSEAAVIEYGEALVESLQAGNIKPSHALWALAGSIGKLGPASDAEVLNFVLKASSDGRDSQFRLVAVQALNNVDVTETNRSKIKQALIAVINQERDYDTYLWANYKLRSMAYDGKKADPDILIALQKYRKREVEHDFDNYHTSGGYGWNVED